MAFITYSFQKVIFFEINFSHTKLLWKNIAKVSPAEGIAKILLLICCRFYFKYFIASYFSLCRKFSFVTTFFPDAISKFFRASPAILPPDFAAFLFWLNPCLPEAY
jgi:hypothetical protein